MSFNKFYESELLRLNCKKAKKILKWQSILRFSETTEMVSKWYRSYYSNPKNINNITTQQIKRYQSIALRRGSKWAKTN